jgi:hypothetical protein
VVDIHLDPGGFGVSPFFPGSDLGEDGFLVVDAAVQALAAQDADFDFHDFQPAGMFRRVVELKPLQQPASLRSREAMHWSRWRPAFIKI